MFSPNDLLLTSPTSSSNRPFLRVTMQVERRLPPLRLTKEGCGRLLDLHSASRSDGKGYNYFHEVSKRESPQRYNYYNKTDFRGLIPVLEKLEDLPDGPIVEKLTKRLARALEANQIGRYYWLPSPHNIYTAQFDDKAATYFLNFKHKSLKGKKGSHGKDKAHMLRKHGGFVRDAESINKFYDWICLELLNYEKTLMNVEYTDKGVKATYLSAFRSIADPSVIIYITHVWVTRYFLPDDDDIKISNLNTAPNLDGWAELLTVVPKYYEDLKEDEEAFANYKHLPKESDLILPDETLSQIDGTFRIESMEALLRSKDDWRKLLQQYDYKHLLCPLDSENYVSDKNFYSVNWGTGERLKVESSDLLPPGRHYGNPQYW